MMFQILITSQIVNLKRIRGRFGFIKCYQCGGETLVPVVKHSVSHSMPAIWSYVHLMQLILSIHLFQNFMCAYHIVVGL